MPQHPLMLYCDNKTAINIANKLVQHDWTKHIEVDQHLIKEKLNRGIICLPYVKSSNQLVDVLTKGLRGKVLYGIVNKMGIYDIYAPSWGEVLRSTTILSRSTILSP